MSSEGQAVVAHVLKRALAGSDPSVAIIRTHISEVFLGSGRAFKLKRAVRFPYLDFSTAERRLTMCQAELDLNRRTASSLWVGVQDDLRCPHRAFPRCLAHCRGLSHGGPLHRPGMTDRESAGRTLICVKVRSFGPPENGKSVADESRKILKGMTSHDHDLRRP